MAQMSLEELAIIFCFKCHSGISFEASGFNCKYAFSTKIRAVILVENGHGLSLVFTHIIDLELE